MPSKKSRLGKKTRDAKRKAAARAKETPKQKQQRLENERKKAAARRAAETPEERENRLGKLRARMTEKRKRWQYECAREARAKQVLEALSAKLSKNPVKCKRQFKKKCVTCIFDAVNGSSSLKLCNVVSKCSCALMPAYITGTSDFEPVTPCIQKETDVETMVVPKSNITDEFSSVLLNACTAPINRQVPSDCSKSQLNICETSTNVKSAFPLSYTLTASTEIITPDEVCITEEEPVDIVCEVDIVQDSLDLPNS